MAKRKRQTTSRDGIVHSYRKAIKMGDSIVISLPAGYCRDHGIVAGDVFAMAANSIISMVKKVE